jgi:hypothetical protein
MVSSGWVWPAEFLYVFPAFSSISSEDQSTPLEGSAARTPVAKRRRDGRRMLVVSYDGIAGGTHFLDMEGDVRYILP